MKGFKAYLFPSLFLLILGATVGAMYFAQNDPLRKEIDTRMAELRQAKSSYDGVWADLTDARKALFFPGGRLLTLEEKKTLQDRIDKDQTKLQDLNVGILSDLSFLERNSFALTQEERDYVRLVRQSLAMMAGQT